MGPRSDMATRVELSEQHLPQDVFTLVVRHTPLVSFDLVVSDDSGAILLGRRRNRPARDYWFVPGGRIYKGESLDEAFLRVTATELGTPFARSQGTFLGVYEHHYSDNFSGTDFGTHYVVLAYGLQAARKALRLPREQHAEFAWLDAAELRERSDVHVNTRAYATVIQKTFSRKESS